MRALLVYYSRSGATERLMKAIGASLESRGHKVEYCSLEPVKAMSYAAAGWAAFRKREARLKEGAPRSLRAHELVLIAGPVFAGRAPAELNTFLNSMPDAVGRRVGVFATMGGPNAEGQLRQIKAKVEKAGGMIIYEDAVKRPMVMNPDQCMRKADDIVEQLLRPSVW
ncbi:MAG: hypothetical protein VB144_03125 [Clostridia bacterium]|nr:hypothetical protein [Clostridia bacterium]